MFSYHQFNLPVAEVMPQLLEALTNQNTVVLQAETGAGKSTLIPPAMLDANWLNNQKIIVLEPRRLAAISIAHRIAEMLGEKVGETVGYRIRFESRIGPKTKIEVVTEGILTRMLQTDNALEGVGMVIFDEFHERSIHADLALALCREAQQLLRPDLRLLIMSATLDAQELTSQLQAPLIESKGRMFPVEMVYGGGHDLRLLPEIIANQIEQATRSHLGDILVFLPGEAEIKRTEELLKNKRHRAVVHALYGMLPHQKQRLAILPDKSGRQKIILATSIAETSLTIEGVTVVIDSGFTRKQVFDPKSGLSRLETQRITADAAEQRAGRAGRLSAGTCYRLWTKADHERLIPHRTPEILETDLCSLVLELAQWGVTQPEKLFWLNAPPQAKIAQAQETLTQIGALENGKITAHGRSINQLPCHPRIANMLRYASAQNEAALACDLAAVLEEKDPLPKDSGIDINLRIEALRRQRERDNLTRPMAKIAQIAAAYRRMLQLDLPENGPVNPYATGLLIAQVYPERIAMSRPGNNAQYQLANGKLAMTGHQDDLAHEAVLAIAHMDARDGMGKIFYASPINPKDLQPLLKTITWVNFDVEEEKIVAETRLCLGSIVLKAQPIAQPPAEQVEQALLQAIIQRPERMLTIDDTFKQLVARIQSLRIWTSDTAWPDWTISQWLEEANLWLLPYLAGMKKASETRSINLAESLLNYFTPALQAKLREWAPAQLPVPSGSTLQLQYFGNGQQPRLAARIQELFGLKDTPTVCNGKVKVLIEMLSPGYKPVQLTADLANFWQHTYFEVRKELKGRYPKHSWPDNPLEAEAVRGVKRKQS